MPNQNNEFNLKIAVKLEREREGERGEREYNQFITFNVNKI